MYSESTQSAPPPNAGKYVRWGVIAALAVAGFLIIGNQGVNLSMNVTEFGDRFTKPLVYSLVSGVILASIALVRVNGASRKSIFWYLLETAIMAITRGGREPLSKGMRAYADHRLGGAQFAMWQLTKVLLLGSFFVNIMFGFAATEFLEGNTLGIESVPAIFSLPFVTPPTDSAYATERVIPMIPSLVLLLPALLGAVGLRLALYVGIHTILRVATSYILDMNESKPRYLSYVSSFEMVLSVGILWTGLNMFFTSELDYNTRYAIAAILAIGVAFAAFSAIDRIRARVLTHILRRDVYVRFLTVIAILIIAVSIMSVNNSIADARKIEYLGPYTAQEIGVNRHLGELDMVSENTHDIDLETVSPNNIGSYVEANSDVLGTIRVWDWEAAFAKLKPEIGLIPYVDFEDNDILRFNNTLYWTASMKPILPSSVTLENRWYNEHLVYTHVPNGFLTLGATDGNIEDSSKLFEQRAIYYGEGGLLDDTWSAYPESRGDTSAELGGTFYTGAGGLSVAPPVSWIFEPNFLLSFPAEAVHVMRYKDIVDRMQVLYPYFLYSLFGKEIDSIPVTDGESSYWLMPLIVGFDARDVPWSAGNPYLRLVGYALIDTYNGDIRLLRTGDDFFTEMFVSQYDAYFEPIPDWLTEQTRYPVELFNWKTNMYNIYHVTDVETFIQANQFYEVPTGLDTYYIQAKPPGFERPEFVGLLSLELRGSQGRNLAGYMVVENDLPRLGRMQFYEVPLNSTTKLIGPTAVREALDRDPDFAQLKTLLRNPRVGDNILYRVGDHDTYFIPVYTAGAGGVVAQLGTIAAVGAEFTGEYYVGLGDTQEEAFEAYLSKLARVTPAGADGDERVLSREARIAAIEALFEGEGAGIVRPASIQASLSFEEARAYFYSAGEEGEAAATILGFIDSFISPSDRIVAWVGEDDTVSYGTITARDGITELHYITVEVGT